MNADAVIRVKITDVNENGYGVARVDNMVVFVPCALDGEIVDIVITSKEKNYMIGKCINIVELSNDRIESPCKSFECCGGCTLCFTSYKKENLIKKNTVRSAFRAVHIPYDFVSDTVYHENRLSYRNKITLHYSEEDQCFGLFKDKTNDLVKLSECKLVSDRINDLIKFINANISCIKKYRPKLLQISSYDGNRLTVTLFCVKDCGDSFEKAIKSSFDKEIKVIIKSENKSSAAVRNYDTEKVLGLDMIYSNEGFRQVNGHVFEKLLLKVCDLAAERDFTRALDLYCGSGVIGLTLANRFKNAKFWGIEINPESIKDARVNAERNDISNIEFYAEDASQFKKHLSSDEYPELVVVDPPRAGLSDTVKKDLVDISPNRIIYVSCNPRTLARDLAYFLDNNYEIKEAVPFNMFPMTKHVETVVMLSH